MEPKQAIETARSTLQSTFEGEIVGDVMLEEVEFEPHNDVWAITLSFVRPFRPSGNQVDDMLQIAARNATMKVVRVPNSAQGRVSIKNHP